MDLNLLRTFLAVYRAGSLTKAARSLGLSQPTVTMQIRALEATLGKQLFIREPRGVRPTGPAEDLAHAVTPHLDGLEHTVDERLLTDSPSGRTLHLGGPAELTAVRVLPALADLVTAGLRLRVTLGLPGPLLDGLVSGHHDLVISTVRPRLTGVSATPLTDEEFVLVAHPRWRERLPADIAADDGAAVDQVPLVAYADELPIIRRYWWTVFERRPTGPPVIVMPDLRGVVDAVAAGVGLSVLPRYLVEDPVSTGRLEVLHEPKLPPINTLYLAVRAAGAVPPHIASVRTRLLRAARDW